MILKNAWLRAFALVLLSIASPAFAWTCDETASLREGRILMTCGIGEGANEDDARREALKNARDELQAVCDLSHDCARFYLNVTPLRTECRKFEDGYRCTRGLRAVITAFPRQSWHEASVSEDAKERFSEDLRELDRLHEITRQIGRGMGGWMSEGRKAPPAVPEPKVIF